MGPLKGLRILDMTSVVMGPFATTVLGDLGADVIKLESLAGDTIRRVGPSRSGEMGGLFLHANRCKRSIAVDLKRPEGLAIALDLAAKMDVLIYNVRPKAMARLGLSYEAVKARKEDILYVGTFGFGQNGRYAHDPAYDDLIQGLAGVPSLIADASEGAPRYVPVNIADRMVGLYACSAILAGLLHRNATGEGQKIDVPMFETMASVVLGDHLGGRSYVPPLDGGGYGRLLSTSRAPFRTADGWLCLLLYTEGNRAEFADLLEGLEDSRVLASAQRIRAAAPGQGIEDAIAEVMPLRSTAEWLCLLGSSGIPHKPLHTIDTILTDPHLSDAAFFRCEDHPSEGKVVSMKVPSDWSTTPPEPTRPAPRLGEHSREILRSIDRADSEIDGLLDRGIVAGPRSETGTMAGEGRRSGGRA